jgi:hypothetical protein
MVLQNMESQGKSLAPFLLLTFEAIRQHTLALITKFCPKNMAALKCFWHGADFDLIP